MEASSENIARAIEVSWLWLIPFFPLLGSAINVAVGHRLQRAFGKRAVHVIAVGVMLLSCLVTEVVFWRYMFGAGLVRTVDNFGKLDETPSHPELLDWLARRFVDGGWSLKTLHRLILTSRTYQQSSTPRPEIAVYDPENRLFGRADVRRLEVDPARRRLDAPGPGGRPAGDPYSCDECGFMRWHRSDKVEP